MGRGVITRIDVLVIAGICLIALSVIIPAVTPPGQTVVFTSFPNTTLINITVTVPPALHQYVQHYLGGWHIYFILAATIVAAALFIYALALTLDELSRKIEKP